MAAKERDMADRTLAEIAQKMHDLDFCMLSTRTESGAIASRPMSNNREVDYDGDSWFFTCDDTRMVEEIAANPQVGLAYQGKAGMLGLRPFFLAVEGRATLIRDNGQFAEHWTKGLDLWFEKGIDTPGLVLIKVHGERAHYWDGGDSGELLLERGAFVGGP
jgi:general stress protein 26